jgi:hypothetical protein
VGRLPNFVYLGPEKSGTTWLYRTLGHHRDIYLTPAKDTFFFGRHWNLGLDWYREQFAHADNQQIVGEIAHRYLTAEPLDRMREVLGEDILVMTTLRNPVEAAWSGYLYYRKHGVVEGSFREALEQRPALLDRCRYATAAATITARFPRESLYVGVFDDLESDPQKFIDGVTDFLGVERMSLSAEDRQPALPAAAPRSLGLARRVRRVANRLRRSGHSQLVTRLKNSALVERTLYRPVDRKAERPSPADVDYIKTELGEEIDSLDREYGLGLRARWNW